MKVRLDDFLVEKNFFETKSKAQAMILAGKVKLNGEKITKAGYQIKDENVQIEIETIPYVSRGGFKLEKAIKSFDIDLSNKICLDAGASTGGFTDCMLQNGAKKVYAVDVGYGQLDWKLRNDERVITIERTNIKNCPFEDIYESEVEAEFLSADLSFISITKVLPNLKNLVLPNATMVFLIKPQFEAGKEKVEKGGVVKNKNTHFEVIKNVIDFAKEAGLFVQGLDFSPITGPKGNIEYLICLNNHSTNFEDEQIWSIINTAYLQLGK